MAGLRSVHLLLLAVSLWQCYMYLASAHSLGGQQQQQPLVGSGFDPNGRKSLDERLAAYEPLDDAFAALGKKTMGKYNVPGLSVVVVQGEKTFAEGYGHAVLPSTRATNRTLYYIGSISKSFTAASLLHLFETTANTSSPIHLHTPVSALIPADFVLPDAYVTQHATIADLLAHRTGMPRHDESYGGSRQTSLKEHVRNLRNLPLTAPFRATFQYCNMMYSTLAHVLETVTGVPFADYVERAVFEPLGMRHAYASRDKALAAGDGDDLAVGYYYHHGSEGKKNKDDDSASDDKQHGYYTPQAPPTSAILTGAGSILLSPLSYAHYLRALLTTHAFLAPSSHALLRTPLIIDNEDTTAAASSSPPSLALAPPHFAPYASPPLYGLAWGQRSVGRWTALTHTGSVTGFGTASMWIPQLRWGVAVFANTDVSSGRAAQVLQWALLEGRVGLEDDDDDGGGGKGLGDGAGFDWAARFARDDEAKEEKRRKARSVVWPDAPGDDAAAPRRRSIDAYEGVYADAGYGEVRVQACPQPSTSTASPLPSSPSSPFTCPAFPSTNASAPLTPLLYVHVRDRTWCHAWYLTHVAGDDFFLAWMHSLPGEPSLLAEGHVPRRAVFRGGLDGRVAQLGVAYEPRMGMDEGLREAGSGADGLVWFSRVE
ncbi:beta-lactamase/transpeptidase-like protein [Phyllosticta citribraziliensis]|uniref:Beta-lactamase/transpeptidase-like protein n=1 Tax=Phyllosticta citribraziliensis TaxID=989973 RepID=A0ABR1LJB2_9PEZI